MSIPLKGKSVADLARNLRNGASWCFWIGGITALNAVLMLSGYKTSLVIGLLLPQVLAHMAASGGPLMKTAGIGINVGACGLFLLLAWLGRNEHRWALILAMIVYGTDSLLL